MSDDKPFQEIPLDEMSAEPTRRSCMSRCHHISNAVLQFLRASSMEMYVGLVLFAVALEGTTLQELTKQKACIQFYNVSQDSCIEMFANETFKSATKDGIVRVTNNYGLYGEFLSFCPGAVLGMFLGPWSDRYGRKVPMIVATVGSIAKTSGIIMNVLAFDLPLVFILLPQVVLGFTGGMLVMVGCGCSLASEQTPADKRTLKFFFMDLSIMVGAPLGSIISGQLYKHYGFLAVFLASQASGILSLVVLFTLITESPKTQAKTSTKLRDLFSLKSVKEMFHAGLMKRPNRVRGQIWVLVLAGSFGITALTGLMGITYLYVNRCFGWSLDEYATINMVGSLGPNLLMIPIMILLTKVKKTPDYVLGLLGCISAVAQNVLRATVSKEFISAPYWVYYLSYPVGMASGISRVAIRSRMSKLISKSEIGKLFSLLITCESFAPLLGMFMFAAIFNSSLNYFSGLPFMVAAVLFAVPAICFLWLGRIPVKNFESLESDTTEMGSELKNTSDKF